MHPRLGRNRAWRAKILLKKGLVSLVAVLGAFKAHSRAIRQEWQQRHDAYRQAVQFTWDGQQGGWSREHFCWKRGQLHCKHEYMPHRRHQRAAFAWAAARHGGGYFGGIRYWGPCHMRGLRSFQNTFPAFRFAHSFSTFHSLRHEAFRRYAAQSSRQQVTFWSQNPNFSRSPQSLKAALSRVGGSKLTRDRDECCPGSQPSRFVGYAPLLTAMDGLSPTQLIKQAWSVCSGSAQHRYHDLQHPSIGKGVAENAQWSPLAAVNSLNSWRDRVSSQVKSSVSAWATSLHTLAAFRVPADTIVQEDQPINEEAGASDTAFVEFDFSTQLSLPTVGELTDETVTALERDIEAHIRELRALVADVRRVADLGELPVSVERDGQVVRVHFPNADSDKVVTLMDDVEATRGVVVDAVGRRHLDSEPSTASSSSSVSDEYSSADTDFFTTSSFEDLMTPGLTQSESSVDDTEAVSDMVVVPVLV